MMIILLMCTILVTATCVSAETITYDAVTTVNHRVYLRARTTGRFFPQGGVPLTFYIDRQKVGRTISTFNGSAVLSYTPRYPGLREIRVVGAVGEASARLLVTRVGEKVILISVEDSLINIPFSEEIPSSTVDILKKIEQRFTPVYVTTLLSTAQARKALMRYGLQTVVILKWRGINTIEGLVDHGVTPYAIVGSPEMVDEAGGYVEHAYTFRDTETGTKVEDWEDIYRHLTE